jgi:hypothetical protein
MLDLLWWSVVLNGLISRLLLFTTWLGMGEATLLVVMHGTSVLLTHTTSIAILVLTVLCGDVTFILHTFELHWLQLKSVAATSLLSRL